MATENDRLKQLIDAANARANSLRDSAKNAVENATRLIREAGRELPRQPFPPSLPSEPDAIVIPEAPEFERVEMDAVGSAPVKPASIPAAVSFPSAPTAQSFGSLTTSEPQRPVAVPTFTGRAPVIRTTFNAPSAPAQFTGTAPNAVSVVLPTAPTISTPTFDGVLPQDIGQAPNINLEFSRSWRDASTSFQSVATQEVDRFMNEVNPEYRSQLALLESKLADYIRGDTETGFSPAVEQAIYGRSQSRQDAESRRVADEAISRAARMGFTMPNGALMGAMNKARQAAADNNAQSSREIVVMQAEMQQKNLQFALSTSASLRQAMVQARISYHGNILQLNSQCVQYASAVADSLVKTYQLAVQAFSARLDAYKADASVYESLVRASLAEVEVYKAKIDGELAKVKVNEAQVQVFKARVDAHQSGVQAYRASIDALAALANVEKLKLDGFEAEVRAFSAQAQASKAEWDAYSAAWGGEESKVKAFIAKADVYRAEVDAYKSIVSAEAVKADATAKTNENNLRAYEAEVRAWAAEVQAHAQIVSSKIDAQKSLVGAYQVGAQAAMSQANAKSERYRAIAGTNIENAKLQGTHLLETAKIRLSALDTSADTSISAAQVYRGLAESAMAGVTTLVTLKEDISDGTP